ncbi:hypothetical protein T4B_5045 [Trichinella pseudospiralis]|uniref:Uncharacterized protein n=1 Tax=Trichinella pseudospiralis TaxID=6337 RepID=A0A0V1GIB2_TRIPS|nr:hypothetical protein T4B_5045 [Trichinella pseudospiralis]
MHLILSSLPTCRRSVFNHIASKMFSFGSYK